MIKLERYQVMNFENAIRGARNPMNSWPKSDSHEGAGFEVGYQIGPNDLKLLQTLCKAGSDHRKFMRQIFVSVDITAPLYYWKEFDTYKVGTTSNSCSTMHKIHQKPFKLDDFSHEKMSSEALLVLENVIYALEAARLKFVETKDKQYWYDMIQLLPSSYNQMRTCTLTYENLFNMFHARKNHKLEEWHIFCGWIVSLPYTKELITE